MRKNFKPVVTRNSQTEFESWIRSHPLPAAGSTGPKQRHVKSVEEDDIPKPCHQYEYEWSATETVVRHCIDQFSSSTWLPTASGFQALGSSGKVLCQIDIPAVMLTTDDKMRTPEDLLLHMPNAVRSQHLIALLVADAAAIGVWKNGTLLRHRVLTGYTVRKQQGKAQLAYQRQGGGGRSVGARIRKRETRRLFQAFSDTLVEWQEDIAECRYLYHSGVTRVWNEVWACQRPAPPVARDDERWRKVPISIRRPRFKVLEHVAHRLSHGCVRTILQAKEASGDDS
ncbi:hypothetical protein WJX84_012427 [Apatococcus fuscideae]|uniref:VLRF1 domain-containing protein n=1 Tax=Apatococcus fuscideae TaxID=2026836 RepID=A0AAW1SUW7_9CHLO